MPVALVKFKGLGVALFPFHNPVIDAVPVTVKLTVVVLSITSPKSIVNVLAAVQLFIVTVVPHLIGVVGKGTCMSLVVKTYSSIYGSYAPNFCVVRCSTNWSLNQDLIPISDTILIGLPSCPCAPNCITADLLVSVKYITSPHWIKLSGLKLIPYSSILAICLPKTSGVETTAPPPTASLNKSLPCCT